MIYSNSEACLIKQNLLFHFFSFLMSLKYYAFLEVRDQHYVYQLCCCCEVKSVSVKLMEITDKLQFGANSINKNLLTLWPLATITNSAILPFDLILEPSHVSGRIKSVDNFNPFRGCSIHSGMCLTAGILNMVAELTLVANSLVK